MVAVAFLGYSDSFESRTIRLAMDALRKTENTVPETSVEYFPSPKIMKATLMENFFPDQMKSSLRRYYGEVKAEYGAYHLLDYVGHIFIRSSKPDMGAWCLAGRDTLQPHVDKALSEYP